MLRIGSNDNVAIVIDYHEIGKKGVQRFFIEKNNPIPVYQDSRIVDSGDINSLIDFVRWGYSNYRGNKYALIIWDHGTSSCLDPHLSRSIETSELFESPLVSDLLNNTTYGFPDFVTKASDPIIQRGSCFDDINRSYINNQSLMYALRVIRDEIMHRLWDVIAWDACLMADVGTADITQDFALYQVSSMQTEPGSGWRYDLIFQPFVEQDLSAEEFAKHIVQCYEQAYCLFINDYTLSAFKLDEFKHLEQNLNDVSEIACECLKHQKAKTVKDALRLSYNRRLCISFDEPNLKDLGNIYSNMLKNISLFQFNDEAVGQRLKAGLTAKLTQGLEIIRRFVIANCAGKSISHAMGVSIYAPETRIHSSFLKTTLSKKGNKWCDLIRLLLIP